MGGLHFPLGWFAFSASGGLYLPLGWFVSSAWVVCTFRLGKPHHPSTYRLPPLHQSSSCATRGNLGDTSGRDIDTNFLISKDYRSKIVKNIGR